MWPTPSKPTRVADAAGPVGDEPVREGVLPARPHPGRRLPRSDPSVERDRAGQAPPAAHCWPLPWRRRRRPGSTRAATSRSHPTAACWPASASSNQVAARNAAIRPAPPASPPCPASSGSTNALAFSPRWQPAGRRQLRRHLPRRSAWPSPPCPRPCRDHADGDRQADSGQRVHLAVGGPMYTLEFAPDGQTLDRRRGPQPAGHRKPSPRHTPQPSQVARDHTFVWNVASPLISHAASLSSATPSPSPVAAACRSWDPSGRIIATGASSGSAVTLWHAALTRASRCPTTRKPEDRDQQAPGGAPCLATAPAARAAYREWASQTRLPPAPDRPSRTATLGVSYRLCK